MAVKDFLSILNTASIQKVVSLSGGLDSSFAASLMRSIYSHDKLYGVSANSKNSLHKRVPSDLSEAEAVALIIKNLNLQKLIVSLKFTKEDIIKFASNCVDGIGNSFEFHVFMNSIQRSGYLNDNLKYKYGFVLMEFY